MKHLISNPIQLGQILLSARRRKKLTQAQAASQAGISQSRLSVLESDPSALTLSQLMTLAALYDLRVSVDDKNNAGPDKAAW